MKRILLSLLVLINFTMSAQCDDRYSEEVFDEVSVSTVTYSDVHNLQMDIYQAVGDTETQRPLIILAHGGSFVAGIRTNPSMVALGNAFAKRGYVVASISYRLMSFFDLLSAEGALNGVARALSDGRAAVRYFRKTVDLEANPYGIDENQIYFGGNSAGGVIAVHSAFMEEEDITDPALLAALAALGGIEGDSGNDGYSSDVRGAISLAGAVADVDFISLSENNKLLISCHGDEDGTVPYSCGQPLGSGILPELCGGGAMLTHTESIGFTNHQHLLYPGQGHVPWQSGGASEVEMIDFVSDNLYAALDCMNIGVIEGCTDESAINYNLDATIDDTSCFFEDVPDCENITITLLNGWNMIGFSCLNNTNASIAFASIEDNIIIVKDGIGNAYLPEWDFNGIGDLERGYGYLMKVTEQTTNYNICE